MAKGLFASLIIGTILKQLGQSFGFGWLAAVGSAAQYMMGASIGVGVALKRGVKPYTLLAAAAAGAIGAGTITDGAAKTGDPAGAVAAAWAAVEAGKLIEGRTRFDLLLAPAAVVLVAGVMGTLVSPWIAAAMNWVGVFVNETTRLHPVPMGILVGVIVGMVLTLPISSAAMCIAIGISGPAAGAAVAGCAAQMVGFAVISFRENRFGGLIAQGIGTSMLQVPNIIKNPWIWLPPTVASGVCGLLSTVAFHIETDKVGAGMGTSGLVGPITTVSVMGFTPYVIVSIALLQFVIPAAVSVVIAEVMRRFGLIKENDMKLA
jgi:uncharacterized membrane protein